METNSNKRQLMKIFAAVLRKRSLETGEVKESINPLVLKTLKRKDLIQIITDKFNGSIPKDIRLMEMENEELLNIIKDDMHVIAYMTQKWSMEKPEEKKEQNTDIIKKIDNALLSSEANEKGGKEDNKTEKKEIPKKQNKVVQGNQIKKK